ncbi:hypothetical protein ACRW0W_15090 [Escherichia coli]|nr:hypothetical protein [Escherichia coli]MCD4051700.1 hypothetical protein [Escherichia coli]MCM2845356.1 hypothetical protein [Escherichia coli]MCN4993998.1 hypothetical protein [Escherichia coli]MCS0843747.1 hypothetical protein [Escherichia coli]MCS0866305.1 hypothetical protein [Escherichia coli]
MLRNRVRRLDYKIMR